MKRTLFLLILLFLSAFCYAQQNLNIRVIGMIPSEGDNRLYQIQVGAFRYSQNAESTYQRLNNASLNPEYDYYLNLTRVVINGVAARDVPYYLQRIQNTGFTEVIIRIDSNRAAVQPPVSTVVVPPPVSGEPVIPVGVAGIVEDRAPITVAVIEEPSPPSIPDEEVQTIVRPDPAPAAPEQPQALPVVPGQQLPAPGNRLPESGYRIGAEYLRQQRNIVFSWDAVEGASAYVITIREASQERREIFRTEPIEQLRFTFDDLKRFDYNGTYVWQVEALRRNSQGVIEQRGQPGENTFTLNSPRTGQGRTITPGEMYGN